MSRRHRHEIILSILPNVYTKILHEILDSFVQNCIDSFIPAELKICVPNAHEKPMLIDFNVSSTVTSMVAAPRGPNCYYMNARPQARWSSFQHITPPHAMVCKLQLASSSLHSAQHYIESTWKQSMAAHRSRKAATSQSIDCARHTDTSTWNFSNTFRVKPLYSLIA